MHREIYFGVYLIHPPLNQYEEFKYCHLPDRSITPAGFIAAGIEIYSQFRNQEMYNKELSNQSHGLPFVGYADVKLEMGFRLAR